ncbi:MAG: hypothetical protein ABIH59_03575 [archaeon]
MVGIGTGFNEKIVTTLLEFLEACYEGLLDKIKEGLDPEEAVKTEFRELKEYISLIQGKMEKIKGIH